MMLTLLPFSASGCVRAPDSKSHLHRLLFCAAVGVRETEIICNHFGDDISSTIRCLCALGATITETDRGLRVLPIRKPPDFVTLDAGESGTTLRFLLPLLGVLGVSGDILCRGRLPERPIAPLDTVLCAHRMTIRREGAAVHVRGKLQPGSFRLPGNISSQFISALLLALPLLDGESRLEIVPPVESAGYIRLTEDALRKAGIDFERTNYVYIIDGKQSFVLPPQIRTEGDWSNAATYLCMGACSPAGVKVSGLSLTSTQPDRIIIQYLRQSGAEVSASENGIFVREKAHCPLCVDASVCPDLVPVLAVLAACAPGESRIENAARLRLKESDRLSGISELLRALGVKVSETPDSITFSGVSRFPAAKLCTRSDHRLAMAAAVAACHAEGELILSDGDCVAKSDPDFWASVQALGGVCK